MARVKNLGIINFGGFTHHGEFKYDNAEVGGLVEASFDIILRLDRPLEAPLIPETVFYDSDGVVWHMNSRAKAEDGEPEIPTLSKDVRSLVRELVARMSAESVHYVLHCEKVEGGLPGIIPNRDVEIVVTRARIGVVQDPSRLLQSIARKMERIMRKTTK